MKVFVSSTCYDLVDLLAELLEEFREIGVEAHFSDDKSSQFVVPSEPTVNSIEACLASLRECDLVVFILSQRYGPPLPQPFGGLSATHCEYNEAKKTGKKILVYVPNDLWGDYSAWKRNGKLDEFKASWAIQKDATGLFRMIDDHVKLVGEDGKADANNWRSTFATSVDLRADLRKHLKPQAIKANAERLIERGETPFVLATKLHAYLSHDERGWRSLEFELTVQNIGPMVAYNLSGKLQFAGGLVTDRSAAIPALFPSVMVDLSQSATMALRLTADQTKAVFEAARAFKADFFCRSHVEYFTPLGFILKEMAQVGLRLQNDRLELVGTPEHAGKSFVSPHALIRYG